MRALARIAPPALAVTLAVFVGTVLAQEAKEGDDGPEPPETKNYLILGRTQFFDGAEAFPAFCKKRGGAKRSELRAQVVETLKEIAAKEQPQILKALGEEASGSAVGLWVFNGVAAKLTEEKAQALKKHPAVRAVYLTGAIAPTGGGPAAVSKVITAKDQKPFELTKTTKASWNMEQLGAPKVWKELGATGEGVVVASIDMGLNYDHEDLRSRIWINPRETPGNGKDDDANGLVDDLYGWDFVKGSPEILHKGKRQHGSWTASLVCGDGTGGMVTGVAPSAKVMPLRAWGGVVISAMGFQYALEQGADVLSMSFSIPNLQETRGVWRLMAEHATAAGLVLVSGAGNFRGKVPVPVEIRIPEGIPCVICVGGVTKKLRPHPMSSRGPVEWESVPLYGDHPMPEGLVKPDVCAFPGPRLGIVAITDTGYMPEKNRRQGNSFSAPQVAGVIALMLCVAPELTPWRVKEILEETAKDLKPPGKDPETGAGLVRPLQAVEAAAKEAAGERTPR